MAERTFRILPLTQLKRARRSLLGRIEHADTRFIVTDYGEAVAELGPLSQAAAEFLERAGRNALHEQEAGSDNAPGSR